MKTDMSKKRPKMSDKPLKIIGITISRASTVSDIARGAPPRLNLAVEVENQGDRPLHVWADCRARKYDASTHVLSLQLAEPVLTLPPHIKMLSDHPRLPTQVAVNAKSRFTIKLQLPGTVRRLTPGQGLGRSFTDDPIGPIDQVEIAVQFATAPIQYLGREAPADFRTRLRAHGDVVRATITPTAGT
jgi:hypothetical protein